MWTKTTLRLSETNTLTQSSLWSLLRRLVYFVEECSFNREPRIPGPDARYICGQYGMRGHKTRGGGRTTGYEASLNVFWCGGCRSLCRLARCGSKGQYSVCAAGPARSARLARTGRASIWDADEDREE